MQGAVRFAPGTIFAGFRIERPLAEGGMGAVYVAEQLSTRKLRALKVMHPQLVPDEKSRARFAEEAQIGASIASDHVVEVVDAGVDAASGVPWLAMELLEGEDLAAIVEREGALPSAVVRNVFRQLGHALAAAHARGIIHRDLKPENVFVARSRRVGAAPIAKILDFGIAKTVAESRTGVTVTTAIGSPLFMAPEQGTPGALLRPATDVWALGLIAFYTLTGKHYWRTMSGGSFSLQTLLSEVLVHSIDPPSVRARDIGATVTLPAGFDGWFSRCVARDPERRFSDGGTASDALVDLLGEGAGETRASRGPGQTVPIPAASATAVIAPPISSSRRSPVILAAAILTVAVVVGAASIAIVLATDSTPNDAQLATSAAAPEVAEREPPVQPALPSESEAPRTIEDIAAPPPAPPSAPAPSSARRPTDERDIDEILDDALGRERRPATTPQAPPQAPPPEPRRAPPPEGGGDIDSLLNAALSGRGGEPARTSAPTPPPPSAPEDSPPTPSRSDVVAAMNSVSGAVSACASGTSGNIYVRVVFAGSTGRVTSAEVARDDLPPPVRSCIARAVRGAHVRRFTEPSFSVNYPFRP